MWIKISTSWLSTPRTMLSMALHILYKINDKMNEFLWTVNCIHRACKFKLVIHKGMQLQSHTGFSIQHILLVHHKFQKSYSVRASVARGYWPEVHANSATKSLHITPDSPSCWATPSTWVSTDEMEPPTPVTMHKLAGCTCSTNESTYESVRASAVCLSFGYHSGNEWLFQCCNFSKNTSEY